MLTHKRIFKLPYFIISKNSMHRLKTLVPVVNFMHSPDQRFLTEISIRFESSWLLSSTANIKATRADERIALAFVVKQLSTTHHAARQPRIFLNCDEIFKIQLLPFIKWLTNVWTGLFALTGGRAFVSFSNSLTKLHLVYPWRVTRVWLLDLPCCYL